MACRSRGRPPQVFLGDIEWTYAQVGRSSGCRYVIGEKDRDVHTQY